jgi:NTP pyrophosphatase (non-canonical NTP hydrolase)
MTNIPHTPQRAAELASFYAGEKLVEAAKPAASPEVRGGLYTPEEEARSAALLNKDITPGTWQDYEMRGVPTISWPEDVMAQFIEDQSKPQSMLDDPRIVAAALAETEARRALLEKRADSNFSVRSGDIPTIVGEPDYSAVINALTTEIHEGNRAAGWWTDIKTGETLLGKDEYGRDRRNVGELLCLVHSEISEAMEGYRKNLMDDKLPHRSMLEVELADAMIRIFDIAGAHNLDLGGAIAEKRAFNAKREDHKLSNRLGANGKQF